MRLPVSWGENCAKDAWLCDVVFKGEAIFVEERHRSKRGLESFNDGMVAPFEV
jgi:hypothetical protein